MIVVRAKGHGGARRFYDRQRTHGTRAYHVFGLSHIVSGSGESFWRLTLWQWTFAFGYEDRKSTNRAAAAHNGETK